VAARPRGPVPVSPRMPSLRRLRLREPHDRPSAGPARVRELPVLNMSGDIVDVFVAVCRQTGISTRLNRASNGLWTVGINRRQSVARLLEHVGRKR
jgi:hypothetical protein